MVAIYAHESGPTFLVLQYNPTWATLYVDASRALTLQLTYFNYRFGIIDN